MRTYTGVLLPLMVALKKVALTMSSQTSGLSTRYDSHSGRP
jgi:hypothetical protein